MSSTLCIASEGKKEGKARLGIFVKCKANENWFYDIYYKNSYVECWLDGQIVYKGPLRKKGGLTRIFHKIISPGSHKLKLSWRAQLKGKAPMRVKLGGRRLPDWISIPEDGFKEYTFYIKEGQTKAIHAIIWREFGLLLNKSGISIREGEYKEDK